LLLLNPSFLLTYYMGLFCIEIIISMVYPNFLFHHILSLDSFLYYYYSLLDFPLNTYLILFPVIFLLFPLIFYLYIYSILWIFMFLFSIFHYLLTQNRYSCYLMIEFINNRRVYIYTKLCTQPL